MNLRSNSSSTVVVRRESSHYGWVVVAVSTILLSMEAGTIQSYGLFLKPLVNDFAWERAPTSGVFSISLVVQGLVAPIAGWLADRFGPGRIMALCGFLVGLGLVLSSQVDALWQLYLTRGVIAGVGLGGVFPVCAATTARWFDSRRGLALGIVSCGIALGTLLMVPLSERLISHYGWSGAFFILGLSAWLFMLGGSFLLRRNSRESQTLTAESPVPSGSTNPLQREGLTMVVRGLGIRLIRRHRLKPLMMLVLVIFLYNFGLQLVVVHLVNYATDMEIAPMVAATFMSVIGISSIAGRLAMGAMSDKFGSHVATSICFAAMSLGMLWLIFSTVAWMFQVFAILFGFVWGGVTPQIPSLVAKFYGLAAVSALVGVVMFGSGIGGAIGAWAGGQVFDMSGSYSVAFLIASAASFMALLASLRLR